MRKECVDHDVSGKPLQAVQNLHEIAPRRVAEIPKHLTEYGDSTKLFVALVMNVTKTHVAKESDEHLTAAQQSVALNNSGGSWNETKQSMS